MLYFESENELKFYNLEARFGKHHIEESYFAFRHVYLIYYMSKLWLSALICCNKGYIWPLIVAFPGDIHFIICNHYSKDE